MSGRLACRAPRDDASAVIDCKTVSHLPGEGPGSLWSDGSGVFRRWRRSWGADGAGRVRLAVRTVQPELRRRRGSSSGWWARYPRPRLRASMGVAKGAAAMMLLSADDHPAAAGEAAGGDSWSEHRRSFRVYCEEHRARASGLQRSCPPCGQWRYHGQWIGAPLPHSHTHIEFSRGRPPVDSG